MGGDQRSEIGGQEEILKANLEEAGDEVYQAELAEWDVALEDGLTS